MEPSQLPDLSGWRYVEIWTLEEVALLWAGVDPANHVGERLQDLRELLPPVQYKKAWMSLRAVSEAIAGGTLPFVESWEVHEDWQGNCFERKVEFPGFVDADRKLTHL
jgi:hypothetical protein